MDSTRTRKERRGERASLGMSLGGDPLKCGLHDERVDKVRMQRPDPEKNLLFGDWFPFVPRFQRCLSYYCDEWLILNRSRVKESTYVKYSGSLEKYIKPRLGACSVETVSTVLVEQFCHDLLFEAALSPKTVRDVLAVLHSVLKYAEKRSARSVDPIEIIYPKIPKCEMRVLSQEEQTTLVQYLLKDMDSCKFGVLLSLMTGMRIGEICALRWNNISLSDRLIKIDSTMQRIRNLNNEGNGRTKVIISAPKSDTSARVVPLTDFGIDLCCMQYPSDDPSAFVLTGTSDRYMEPRTMQYRIRKYTEACGLSGVHFHTLRHTFATRCIEVDFEIKSLSEILGHASPRITLERYVHSSLELKRNNMNKLSFLGL